MRILKPVISAARALISGSRASLIRRDASVIDFRGGCFSGLRRVTPQQIFAALEQASGGGLDQQAELFSLMEDTWPRLAKNLGEVRRAASRATYSVAPYVRRGQKATQGAGEKAALVDAAIRSWSPVPGTFDLGFEDTLFHALDALGKGISVLRLDWQYSPEGALPRAARMLPSRAFGWNSATDRLGLLHSNGGWYPFEQDNYLVGLWQARSGAPGATALLRPLTPYWLGITLGWQWLMSNAQMFGVPFRWATYRRDDAKTGEQLRDMLADMGACGYGAFPEGTSLEFREVSQNVTGNPQLVIQDLANRACDLLILGQELSATAQPAGLGNGAANLQGAVRADRLAAAAQWCADLLNYQLVPAVIRKNYGDTREAPVITPDLEQEDAPKTLAERDAILLSAGVSMPRDWFYERHAIPVPLDGEAVVQAPTPAAPFPGGGPGATPLLASRPSRTVRSVRAAAPEALAKTRDRLAALLPAARTEDFLPIAERLDAALALDGEEQTAALKALVSDFPNIFAAVMNSDAAANALADASETAAKEALA